MYGVPDNLAVYSDRGDSFNVGGAGGGRGGRRRRRAARRGGGGRGGGPGARATGRGTPDDPDVVQGRPANEGTDAAVHAAPTARRRPAADAATPITRAARSCGRA